MRRGPPVSPCRCGLLFLACGIGFAAGVPAYTFAVLGDRTGEARPAVFAQIVDEVKLLDPDFLFSTGDLVEGYTRDRAELESQWDSVLALVRWAGVPFHASPGNHDISNPAAESVYLRRVGPRRRVLRHGNASFVFFDNSRWSRADSLPAAELAWLETELARARKSRHRFVFMHRPYWRAALERGQPDPTHDLFRRYGVDYVFTGHDHFYCRHEQDSITYFQVGPSGSRTKVYDDREQGAFQNYLWCRVSGDSVTVEVREPGRYTPLPDSVVTWDAVRALDRARREAVRIDRVAVPDSGRVTARVRAEIGNLTAAPMSGEFAWQDSGTAWRALPARVSVSMTPGGSVRQWFDLSLAAADSVYPLPRYSLPYEYRPGRSAMLKACLPVQRQARRVHVSPRPVLDGRLDDPCWQAAPSLAGFGEKAGGRLAIEPTEVWVGADESLLYIAVRSRESDTARIRTAVLERDGRVYDDDHVNVVLGTRSESPGDSVASLVYYQLFVNAAGTIADRRCVMQGSESSRDYAWDGNWRVAARKDEDGWAAELCCPRADFGTVGRYWTVNAVRFQSRLKDIGVWQVPFEHDPASFGRLIP